MAAQSLTEAECRWCGAVTLQTADLRCAVAPKACDLGLCEFVCPICDRLAVVARTAANIEALTNEGARAIVGLVPFEILERHTGPALSWDDVFDLHLALDHTSIPQAELAA